MSVLSRNYCHPLGIGDDTNQKVRVCIHVTLSLYCVDVVPIQQKIIDPLRNHPLSDKRFDQDSILLSLIPQLGYS
jgi:hypothetical protein